MEDQAPASTVLGGAIVEWLAGEALHDSEPEVLYSGGDGSVCRRGSGPLAPAWRVSVARV